MFQKLSNTQYSLREAISQEKYNLNGSTAALRQDAIQFTAMSMQARKKMFKNFAKKFSQKNRVHK